MNLCLALGALALFSPLLYGAPLGGLPANPTTTECHIRCYEIDDKGHETWLSEMNDTVTICTRTPQQIQNALDEACRLEHRPSKPGAVVKAFMNWPATPGNIVACKNIGNKCDRVGPILTMWECPASCYLGEAYTPTIFWLCASGRQRGYKDGLSLYRTDGPMPICPAGTRLDASAASEPFGDPPWLLCRSTQKECAMSSAVAAR